MKIQVKKLSLNKYEMLLRDKKDIPLWLTPKLITCYKEKLLLVAYRGNQLVGIWAVPLVISGEIKIARREFRYFPYSSPHLFERDNLKRREAAIELFRYLTNYCNDINLPFDPQFREFAPIQSLGALIEWRHTHVLGGAIGYDKIPSRLRNHIENAKKQIRIEIDSDCSKFDFEQAIKGSDGERHAREKSAINLVKKGHAKIISAYLGDKICAGIFLATDSATAYMMHSWRSDDAPRGTMSAMIFDAVNWAFSEKHIKQYDFEGSILQKVDYYFSGFNCQIEPFGHAFWSKTRKSLFGMLKKSIDIPERRIII